MSTAYLVWLLMALVFVLLHSSQMARESKRGCGPRAISDGLLVAFWSLLGVGLLFPPAYTSIMLAVPG